MPEFFTYLFQSLTVAILDEGRMVLHLRRCAGTPTMFLLIFTWKCFQGIAHLSPFLTPYPTFFSSQCGLKVRAGLAGDWRAGPFPDTPLSTRKLRVATLKLFSLNLDISVPIIIIIIIIIQSLEGTATCGRIDYILG